MILSGSEIREALVSSINALMTPVKAWSLMPPTETNRYIIIALLTENALDDKLSFMSEGTLSIQICEKFIGRAGNLDWVSSTARTIVNEITPNRLSTFGNLSGINIFTMQFAGSGEDVIEGSEGRTAIKSLRLNYKSQNS